MKFVRCKTIFGSITLRYSEGSDNIRCTVYGIAYILLYCTCNNTEYVVCLLSNLCSTGSCVSSAHHSTIIRNVTCTILPSNTPTKWVTFRWLLVTKCSLSDSSWSAVLNIDSSVISISWDMGPRPVAAPANTSNEFIAWIALEANCSTRAIVLIAISTDFVAQSSSFSPAFNTCIT